MSQLRSLTRKVAIFDSYVNASVKAALGLLVGKNRLTIPRHSDSSPHLPPSNGYYHWPARAEN